jgi:hypothetical protein
LNEVKKDFLNKEELQKIIEKVFGIDRLSPVRDFLFSAASQDWPMPMYNLGLSMINKQD